MPNMPAQHHDERCRIQARALSADYRVVIIDLRGFGQSDKAEAGYSGENSVGDLKYLIDHLNLKRPIIPAIKPLDRQMLGKLIQSRTD
jgi:pimeloyl-ACP methyl ester carboxylesterase